MSPYQQYEQNPAIKWAVENEAVSSEEIKREEVTEANQELEIKGFGFKLTLLIEATPVTLHIFMTV